MALSLNSATILNRETTSWIIRFISNKILGEATSGDVIQVTSHPEASPSKKATAAISAANQQQRAIKDDRAVSPSESLAQASAQG